MNNHPYRYDVFLSHNGADKPAVEELARRLVQAGLSPFLDIWHLVPGEPFQEAIEEALDNGLNTKSTNCSNSRVT